MAGGKKLPAGPYTVSRLSDDKFDGLILNSYDKRASVLVFPSEIESASADKPQVSFERVGDQQFLSTIQTTNDVYNIRVSRSVIARAIARSRDNVSVSGSAGSN